MRPSKNNNLILFLFLVLNSFYACTEGEEGCLDPDATNLDITADKNCCCTYPDISLDFSFTWGVDSVRFYIDSIYVLDSGDSLVIRDLRMYLSDVVFENDQLQLSILDSVVNSNSEYLTDDLMLLDLNKFIVSAGSRKGSGDYNKLSISLGANSNWLNVDTLELQDSHPWLEQALWVDNVHGFGRFEYDLIDQDTSRFAHVFYDPFYSTTTFEGDWNLQQAKNFVAKFNLDIRSLTDGIDFQNDSESVVQQKFESNFTTAISAK